jgi:hypothetical protein
MLRGGLLNKMLLLDILVIRIPFLLDFFFGKGTKVVEVVFEK